MTDSLSIVSEAPRPRDLERLESRITGATRRLSELQAQLRRRQHRVPVVEACGPARR